MQLKKYFFMCLGIAVVMAVMSFLRIERKATCTVSIRLYHYDGSELLQLDSGQYINSLGQHYSVSMFKYYIGKIRLKQVDGKEYSSDGYFLVNEEEPGSKTITLSGVPEGSYSSIVFILGVDSLHNCSGAQSGALDPVHGMFWTWNTGYIFLKMEGHAPVSTSPGHIFEFHIGGYKEPANCIRQIELKPIKPVIVSSSMNNLVNIKADVSAILQNPVGIDFATTSSVTDFHHATMVADNYKNMFSVLDP